MFTAIGRHLPGIAELQLGLGLPYTGKLFLVASTSQASTGQPACPVAVTQCSNAKADSIPPLGASNACLRVRMCRRPNQVGSWSTHNWYYSLQ